MPHTDNEFDIRPRKQNRIYAVEFEWKMIVKRAVP